MARRSDDPVIIAARGLVETLAADPVFVKEVATTEIERQIAAGLLIPRDRLQIAPGLTIVPLGRVEELEAFITLVVDELGDTFPAPLAERAAALTGTGVQSDDAEAPGDDDAEAPGDDDGDDHEAPVEPAAEPPAEPATTDEPDPEAADEEPPPERGRRRLPTEPLPCESCGTTALTDDDTPEANLEQTKVSIIRFREPLCRPCMASH